MYGIGVVCILILTMLLIPALLETSRNLAAGHLFDFRSKNLIWVSFIAQHISLVDVETFWLGIILQ